MTAMFSKISAFIHQAAEVTTQVLAPQPSRPEEFGAHWKAVTESMTADGAESSSVDSLGVTTHLEAMVEQLCEEEEERDPRDPGSMGPCLEFVLRHKIMDTLYAAGDSDFPPGMRHQVLLFFTLCLGRVERGLLPHVSIHQPVQKQVSSCGRDPAAPLAIHEVQFLRTLCVKMQRDPRLADFFLKETKTGNKKFLITEALLRLVNCQDSLVVLKTYECLLTCVSLPHPVVCAAIAGSQLPMLLASKLQYHCQLIPPSLHHSTITTCRSGWGGDFVVEGAACLSSPSAEAQWHLEAYLAWLDYCEQTVVSSIKPLSSAVCESVHELLLSATLLPRLARPAEEDVLLNTAILNKSLQTLSHSALLQEFVTFVLSPTTVLGDSAHTLLDRLIQRTDHPSDEVCQVALQLFDVLLHCPLPSPTHELVLRHWSGDPHSPLPLPPEQLQAEREALEESVSSYLSLVPDYLCSSVQVTGNSGLELYLMDAHKQVANCRALVVMCGQYYPSFGLSGRKEGDTARDLEVCEGPLLTALLTKLERILDQPYEVNLLLTSIFSTLAALSHPMVDQWLCAIFCKHKHSRTIFSILRKVSGDLQLHAERSPGLLVSLVEARRRLLGMETSDLLSMPHNDLLEGAIVLEEFTKELASILYAKQTSAMLSLPQ